MALAPYLCGKTVAVMGLGKSGTATARALAGFLARVLDCGAVTEPELGELTGLDRAGLDAFR